ncbi:hypothetical protein SLEP1_g2391 [Rubroshorea leprosula]|uniref:Uncharacterized protein n=1 Tax=Rubroshorea leprosula TaxID=152421 RepID=A0AAV5HRI2_9ROSI|nr:hypothetical protein SLEP1_g2391 [Rubroshorea leprosula]
MVGRSGASLEKIGEVHHKCGRLPSVSESTELIGPPSSESMVHLSCSHFTDKIIREV